MDRTAVARVLDQIASMMELKGENTFRIRAFRTASRTIAGLPESVEAALEDNTLAATKGIGPAILRIVTDLVRTGGSPLLDDLREQVPPGLVEMLGISGLGVSKIRQIHDLLDIDSVPELESAARDGRLAKLPGFGPKTCENILKGIGFLRRTASFRLLHHATEEAEHLREALEHIPGVTAAIVAGDVRRKAEVVKEVVLVLMADVPSAEILERLGQIPGLSEFSGQDERRATLRFAGGGSAQIVVTPPVNLGAVLVQATGSEQHLAALSARAADRGYSLSGAALWRGSDFVPTPDERALYQALGLPDLPPELREGRGETERSEDEVPHLLARADLRGFLHCHTTYSDGSTDAATLALACRDAGYAYVGITDHSSSAAYAGGIRPDQLPAQWAEIDEANARLDGIRILKGIEADILQDGGLDYDDATLAGFDFVIGSVHIRYGMGEAEMTERVLTALDNPYLTILGHPTGRLLLQREPYPLNLEAILARAGERGVAIEINGDPHRLDLDWRMLPQARAGGAMISIGADAHSVSGLRHVDWGVAMARKGGLGPGDVLNTLPVEDFLAFAARRRSR